VNSFETSGIDSGYDKVSSVYKEEDNIDFDDVMYLKSRWGHGTGKFYGR